MASAGANPYLVEPLRACEYATFGYREGPAAWQVVPAPLPPYAIGALEPLARLDFLTATCVWIALIAGSFVALVVALRAITGLPTSRIAGLTVLACAIESIGIGQIVPFVIASVACAALAIERGRPAIAAAALLPAAFEPHVAIGAIAGLFFSGRGGALAACGLGLALATASVIALGVPTGFAYLRDVLPAHGASELYNAGQYGLSSLLVALGVAPKAALTAGFFGAALSLGAGVAIGRKCARATGHASLRVLIPAAAMVGVAPFVHVTQLAVALPAALAVFALRSGDGAVRRGAATSTALLAIPWGDVLTLSADLPVVVLPALLAAEPFVGAAGLRYLFAALVALAASFAVEAFRIPPIVAKPPSLPPTALAETAWFRTIVLQYSHNVVLLYALKIPSWAGLIALGGACARLSRRGEATGT